MLFLPQGVACSLLDSVGWPLNVSSKNLKKKKMEKVVVGPLSVEERK